MVDNIIKSTNRSDLIPQHVCTRPKTGARFSSASVFAVSVFRKFTVWPVVLNIMMIIIGARV